MEPFVDHLVVDSAAFIKYAKLENIGKTIYTVQDVVDEIKDKATRDRLQVLPYELNFLTPAPEDLKFVTEFSKKTGDFASLSVTDLKLIALTYQLEKSIIGSVDHLKIEPVVVRKKEENARNVEPKNEECGREYSPENAPKTKQQTLPPGFYKPEVSKLEEKLESSTLNDENSTDNQIEDDNVNEEDEDEGWITPQNLSQINETTLKRDPVKVGCITGDFAMQNVLMHIGLNVVSLNDGSIIKRLNTYILRCFSCYKTTSIMTKKFCPDCGNQTLKRVAVTVNEDGSRNIHISKRRTINTKGFNRSIPLFRGGKHADNPIVCPDQPMPQNRLSNKALQKLNVLDADYVARDSPFLDKDIYSRSALLGIHKLANNKTKRRR